MNAAEIRRYRRKTGLTQKQLAAELGVSQACVCQWERDHKKPSRPVVLLFQHLQRTIKHAKKK